jgi:hypothetical protein
MLKSISTWYKNVANRCDALELEQGAIRVVIGSFFTLYLLASFAIDKDIDSGELNGFYCLIVFEIFAVIFFL